MYEQLFNGHINKEIKYFSLEINCPLKHKRQMNRQNNSGIDHMFIG